MPTIPFPQQGQLAADFTGPRQRGGGVRVDRSELQNAYSTLKQATGTGVRIPLVDVSSGLQNLGQGISNVGNQMLKVQEQNQKLTDARIMADVQTAWELDQDKLKLKLQEEKDPNQWGRIAEEHTQQFISSVNTEGMTEMARHHLMENYLKTQASNRVTTAQFNGVMENERRTSNSLTASAEVAVRNKNPAGYVQAEKTKEGLGIQTTQETALNILKHADVMNNEVYQSITTNINDALKRGSVAEARAVIDKHPDAKFLYPDQLEHINSVVNVAESKALTDDMIAKDPKRFLNDVLDAQQGKGNAALKDVNPAELKDLEDRARQRIQLNSNQVTADAADDVATGVLKTPAQLYQPRYLNMSASDKKHVQVILEKQAAEGKKFNNQAWMAYATGIPSIKPGTPQGELDAAQMQSFINIQFAGDAQKPYRDRLLSMLDRHMNGSPADADNQAQKILLDGFKAGGFGVTEVPYDPGRTPGIMSSIMAGITGNSSWLEYREPTSLTPEDQARLNQPDKIAGEKNAMKLRPGQKVVDQRAYADAQKMLFDAQTHIEEMRKQGKTEKEMVDFARSALRVSAIRGIVKPQTTPVPAAQKLQKVTDLLNNLPEPNNTLFPN